MGRPPEENTARSETVAFRIGSELSLMEKRLADTGESRSRYLRRLIREDATKTRAPKRKSIIPPFPKQHDYFTTPIPPFTTKRGGIKYGEVTEEKRKELDTYAIGTRWADKDSRSAGRVVEVKAIENGVPNKRIVEVEAHPTNPSAVGHRTTVSIQTLETRYRKISR